MYEQMTQRDPDGINSLDYKVFYGFTVEEALQKRFKKLNSDPAVKIE